MISFSSPCSMHFMSNLLPQLKPQPQFSMLTEWPDMAISWQITCFITIFIAWNPLLVPSYEKLHPTSFSNIIV